MERGLSIYHPLVSFLYFVIVIGASMLFMHPVFIIISFLSSIIYSIILDRERSFKILKISFAMIIVIALTNFIFVNRGITVLAYFRGNPLTMESLLYGVVSGMMMASVVMWFSCYNQIITSDKFLYIFSKTLPSVALVVSMTLRLIPKFIAQAKIISDAQRAIGIDFKTGSIIARAKSLTRILSILVTWGLEDAVQTADSMKARGYGIKGRTSFSIYIFALRDKIMIGIIGSITMFLFVGYINGFASLLFYPTIENIKFDLLSLIVYCAFIVIAIIPSVIELMEEYRWKYLR